ncbi:hypothetical protein ABLN67_06255, partial [Mycobacterium tuberculosis]
CTSFGPSGGCLTVSSSGGEWSFRHLSLKRFRCAASKCIASSFCAATETATLKAYWAHVWQRVDPHEMPPLGRGLAEFSGW